MTKETTLYNDFVLLRIYDDSGQMIHAEKFSGELDSTEYAKRYFSHCEWLPTKIKQRPLTYEVEETNNKTILDDGFYQVILNKDNGIEDIQNSLEFFKNKISASHKAMNRAKRQYRMLKDYKNKNFGVDDLEDEV